MFVLLYSVCRSVSGLSLMCVRHSIFYVCVTCYDLLRRHYKTDRDSARESERQEQRPLACTIKRKRRNKIRNLWLWLVCCSLLPTCYFHRPFTSIPGLKPAPSVDPVCFACTYCRLHGDSLSFFATGKMGKADLFRKLVWG